MMKTKLAESDHKPQNSGYFKKTEITCKRLYFPFPYLYFSGSLPRPKIVLIYKIYDTRHLYSKLCI